eukprot:SAG22_NODE_14413_length_375_cov_0.934783_1_plen_29_part_10
MPRSALVADARFAADDAAWPAHLEEEGFA